jgi:hypothetical protein
VRRSSMPAYAPVTSQFEIENGPGLDATHRSLTRHRRFDVASPASCRWIVDAPGGSSLSMCRLLQTGRCG